MDKNSVLKSPDKFLTIEEVKDFVAKEFGRHWSSSYIYSLVNEGKLESIKLGQMFPKDSIVSLVKSFKKAAPPLLQKVN